MSNLLEVRETIKRLYGKYEMYITPVLKFLLTLVGIIMINSCLGYMDLLNNVLILHLSNSIPFLTPVARLGFFVVENSLPKKNLQTMA